MDFSPEVSRYPKGGGDWLGLICSELGVAPLVDPGTDLKYEMADTSWFPVGGRGRVHASFSDVGRGRGRDTCSLGGGGLAGDGDAHC